MDTFREFLETKCISEAKLARAVDRSLSAVYRWRDTSVLPVGMAATIAEALGDSSLEEVLVHLESVRGPGRPRIDDVTAYMEKNWDGEWVVTE